MKMELNTQKMPPDYYVVDRKDETNKTLIYILANEKRQKYIFLYNKKKVCNKSTGKKKINCLMKNVCGKLYYIFFFCCFLAHTPSECSHRKSVGKRCYTFAVCICCWLLCFAFAFSLCFFFFCSCISFFILFLPISYVYYSFMFRELLSTREKMNRK